MTGPRPSKNSERRSNRRLSAEEARQLFRYEEETGNLVWRVDKGRARKGNIVGCRDDKGYLQVMVDRRNYKAHLLIWLIKTGEWPLRQIDHRDTNKANNRWHNFRLATNQQNHANRGKNKNNTSGYKDVVFIRNCPQRPWQARITVNGKQIAFGQHASPEEAALAVADGHRQYFGEFSRT